MEKENYRQPLTRWTKNGTLKNTDNRVQNVQKPAYTANSDIEKLVEAGDKRARMLKGKQYLAIPNLNSLYDSLKTPAAWRYCSDAYATGQFTTVAGSTVSSKVSLIHNKTWDVQRWPGGVQVYHVINFFSVAGEQAITNIGNIIVTFTHSSGYTIPLGVMLSNASFTNSNDLLIPSPVVDPGDNTIGTLNFTLSNQGTPTVGIYDYVISVSAAYLLPAKYGYEVHEYDNWQEVAHEERNYSGLK